MVDGVTLWGFMASTICLVLGLQCDRSHLCN